MSDAVDRFISQQYRVVVGLGHPARLEALMRIASVFARRQKGRIVAVSVVRVPAGVESREAADHADPELLEAAEQVVQRAQDFGAELGIAVEPLVEFAPDVAPGIAAVSAREDADMILLGFSPPEEAPGDTDVPARITERVAAMAGPSLAIVAPPRGDKPARMLIPVTETLDAAVIGDLVKVVALFGHAEMTFIGLVERGLDEEQFQRRSDALRARVEGVDFEEIERVDLDARQATRWLFGAEARQMAGETHEAAFILRATV